MLHTLAIFSLQVKLETKLSVSVTVFSQFDSIASAVVVFQHFLVFCTTVTFSLDKVYYFEFEYMDFGTKQSNPYMHSMHASHELSTNG